MPPRNLKSLFASVALPAWFPGHNPSEQVVAGARWIPAVGATGFQKNGAGQERTPVWSLFLLCYLAFAKIV